MNTQLMPIPFYDDTLQLVCRGDEPYVAMKPVVENIGLDWKSQHVKLTEKFNSVMVEIAATGADGKQYNMTCLPLRKIAAWLYSINPNKVAPELRHKILRYQDECDDALWNYWTNGIANGSSVTGLPMLLPRDPIQPLGVRGRNNVLKVRDMLLLQDQKYKLMKQIRQSSSLAIRAGLFVDLRRVSDALGVCVPDLSTFEMPNAQIPHQVDD